MCRLEKVVRLLMTRKKKQVFYLGRNLKIIKKTIDAPQKRGKQGGRMKDTHGHRMQVRCRMLLSHYLLYSGRCSLLVVFGMLLSQRPEYNK